MATRLYDFVYMLAKMKLIYIAIAIPQLGGMTFALSHMQSFFFLKKQIVATAKTIQNRPDLGDEERTFQLA